MSGCRGHLGPWSTTESSGAHMPGVGLGIWIGGALAGAATPNDLFIGGSRACVGWWISNNGALPYGSVTLDEASLDPDFSTWANYGGVAATWTPGQADPLGGSAGWSLREENSVSGIHGRNAFASARVINAPAIFRIYWKSIGDRWLWIQDAQDGIPEAKVNPADGAVTAVLGSLVSGSSTSVGGGWWLTEIQTTTHTLRYGVISGTSSSHTLTGDSSKGLNLYLPQAIQPRVSVMTDESLTALNEKRNAHLTQGTDANQPLFYTGFASVNGLPVAYGEGRVSYLRTTHADVIGAVSGNPPTYALFGVASMAGSGCRLIHATGIADYEIPIYDSAGTLYSYRTNGTVSNKSFGVATSLLATAKTYAVVSNSDRTVDLYIDGSYIASVTHNAIGAVAITIFDTFHPASTGDSNELAEMALLSGQIPGAAAAARYAWLKPTLQAMGARWGGLAA